MSATIDVASPAPADEIQEDLVGSPNDHAHAAHAFRVVG